ncbi:hypothetical protein MSPP1_000742 [Malassezia sp. CBS 17886]|nr:hypothetical protein MSPP1_000742 [Malassezia sp. CBS 17886]
MSSPTVPAEMRAVLIHGGKGPSSALYIGEVPTPRISDETPDDVLVKVRAFALNRMDLLQREGQYPVPPGASPILGVEFSGTVVHRGSGVKDVDIGAPVFGLATGGAYAEYVRVPASMVIKKDPALSWAQAAVIPEAFLTAFQALHMQSQLQRGEDVLIHAGASGVGLAAIQVARMLGARHVYVTAGSQQKIDTCKRLGATGGFNYKQEDWRSAVLAATDNRGVDVIMDFIGAPYFAANLACLKRDGRMTMQGFMGGSVLPKETNLGLLLMKRLRIEGGTLRSRTLAYQSGLVQGFVDRGGLTGILHGLPGEPSRDITQRLIIYQEFDWHSISEAQDVMAANKNVGKIVVHVS